MHAMPAACVRTIQYFMCALGFFPPPEKSKAELSLGLVLKSSGGMINDWILHRCVPSQLRASNTVDYETRILCYEMCLILKVAFFQKV